MTPALLRRLTVAGLLLLVVLFLVLRGGDDEDITEPQDGQGAVAEQDGGETSSPGASDDAEAAPEPVPETPVDPDAGALSAGETPVFPLSEPGQDLTVYLDVPVRASAAPVESVVGAGFWVGPSPQERVWVLPVPAEGVEQTLESGSVVAFDGARFVPHDEGFAADVGVGEAGAEQLTAQRAHVEVPASAVRVVS